MRPGHKNRYHVWNADQRMKEQIRRLSQPRFREEQRQCEQYDKNNGRFFRQERRKKKNDSASHRNLAFSRSRKISQKMNERNPKKNSRSSLHAEDHMIASECPS